MTKRVLMTRAEVAERLGISIRTVDEMLADGRLPKRKIGNLPRVHEDDVRHVEEHGVPTRAQLAASK